MQYGTYSTLREFKDEDRYFGLTKRQLAWAMPGVGLCGLIGTFFGKLGLIEAAIFIDLLVIGFCALMMLGKLPSTKYLTGGGLFVQDILIRVIARKMGKNRVIYTKNRTEGY